jgi:PhzF family phenazine biosynthesis protein
VSSGAERHVAVTHFRVFGRAAGGGSPCPVVEDSTELSADDMQQLAAHLGEESGFVSCRGDGWRFRFFMPRSEVPMCVHATVAATTALVRKKRVARSGEMSVRTESGPCRVRWDDRFPPRVTVEQQRPRFGDPVHVAVLTEQALGLGRGAIDGNQPIRSVSVSTPKLMVPLLTPHDVHRVEPEFDALRQLCADLWTTGAYVFAPLPGGRARHFVARQFPVGGGVREDPATGVAAGALAAYVAQRAESATSTWIAIEIDQGDKMGCPCTLHAAAYVKAGEIARTTVTGSASFTGEARVSLSAGAA